MERIAVTQRTLTFYGSPHDALDRKWFDFFSIAGIIPVLLPNKPELAEKLLESVPVAGYLLTGGETPAEYDGTNPERDSIDYMCIDRASTDKKPLLAVCRGMECLMVRFEIPLRVINQSHVGPGHRVRFSDGREAIKNSYHTFGLAQGRPCDPFEIIGVAEDGAIEAVRHENMMGIMWHPERHEPFHQDDIDLVKKWFNL